MYKKYLVTGATGFLGKEVVANLIKKGAVVYALTMPKDPYAENLPQEVIRITGDVCDGKSLDDFFDFADENACVIHCAGIVSVATDPGEKIYRVNVGGTKNILERCKQKSVGKLVYVSSVHAIPEKPKGEEISEVYDFSPDKVKGDYAKSKAMATQLVLEYAKQGLDASLVFPSGIIGPNDEAKGSITTMLLSFLEGKLPLAVKGGYDFVDVRDVAEGIVLCSEKGERGKCYILSGHYATIKDVLKSVKLLTGVKRVISCLPIKIAKLFAPIYEKIAVRRKKKLFFTPYAVEVLDSNGKFSRKNAEKSLGYKPRPIIDTLKDTVSWLTKKRKKARLACC